jgi:hypothetical protein
MVAEDYPQFRHAENRVGRHYTRFEPLPRLHPLFIKHLAGEDSENSGRIREVRLDQDELVQSPGIIVRGSGRSSKHNAFGDYWMPRLRGA